MIQVRDVRKVFNMGRPNEFVALDGVSLAVEARKATVLKGPSGSGKTTLLSLLGCMARPTSGRIHFMEREITSLPEHFLTEIRRRSFGFIFQQFNLIRGITALENVMVPAYPTGEKYSMLRSRAMDLLELFGVAGKAASMPWPQSEAGVRSVEGLEEAEMMRPAGEKLDKLADPQEVIAKDSVLWEVIRTYRELGIHRRGIPKALGGMLEDMDPMTNLLIGEELGYDDAGLAISFGAGGMPFAYAALFPHPKLQEMARAYAEDTKGELIGCWAITEPDHGSDWVMGGADPRTGPSVRGIKKGDEYIVTGQKSAWVSNGTIATHAVLHVGLEPEQGMQGQGLAIIPLDLPGITRGKPLDKIGQRPLNQGEIYFEEVKIPKEYMVVTPEMGIMEGMGEAILAGANGGMGITFAGLAKAAYDEAFRYANERIQGGVPILQHQNIRLKLFRMFTLVEAARAATRRMALYNAAHQPPSAPHAVACKVFSTETAFQVASEAIQIFGGYGLSREYPVEKMFRDARAAMIEDGVNETLSLAAVQYL